MPRVLSVLELTSGIGGRRETDQGRQPYNADDRDAVSHQRLKTKFSRDSHSQVQ